ncbi:MAG: GxxExxY protein [Bacteroidales bacterium]|nr:GxxExxY protein [Bacteroidales bacterium]
MDINSLTFDIIGAAIEVHSALGPGLLESLYQKALYLELKERGHIVVAEYPVAVFYKGQKISENLRVDLLVDNEIVVELKSVEELNSIHFKQTASYLRILNKQIGLIINFNVISLKDGVNRVINPYYNKNHRP